MTQDEYKQKEKEYREEVAILNMLVSNMSETDDETDEVIDRLFDKIKYPEIPKDNKWIEQ